MRFDQGSTRERTRTSSRAVLAPSRDRPRGRQTSAALPSLAAAGPLLLEGYSETSSAFGRAAEFFRSAFRSAFFSFRSRLVCSRWRFVTDGRALAIFSPLLSRCATPLGGAAAQQYASTTAKSPRLAQIRHGVRVCEKPRRHSKIRESTEGAAAVTYHAAD